MGAIRLTVAVLWYVGARAAKSSGRNRDFTVTCRINGGRELSIFGANSVGNRGRVGYYKEITLYDTDMLSSRDVNDEISWSYSSDLAMACCCWSRRCLLVQQLQPIHPSLSRPSQFFPLPPADNQAHGDTCVDEQAMQQYNRRRRVRIDHAKVIPIHV